MFEFKVLAVLPILVNFFLPSNSQSILKEQPFSPFATDEFCSSTCSSDGVSEPTIIKYKENEINRYKLEGLTSIHLPNTLKEESTKLTYAASFEVAAENKCSFLLRVNQVEIVGLDGKKYTDSSLIGSVAKFSFNNGRLEKLCVDKEESEVSTNFKRAIITNLQISSWGNPITGSMAGSSIYETDMYGRCPVSLEMTQEPNGSWIIKKNKDLNQCKYRQGIDFAIKTSSFQSDGSHQTNPFVDASLRSVLKVEKGIIKTSEINEEYIYQPLTKYGDSQTSVVVTTRITFIGSKNGVLQAPVNSKPASLLYETVKSYRSDATVATLIKAIQEASQEQEANVVPPDGANTFSHFISILQEVNKGELLIVHDQVKSGAGFKNKDTAMDVFWGGLLSAGTPVTTETAATLLMNREMPMDKVPEFLANLAFVKHPTEETLNTLSPLLDGPNVAVDRYLAIGSLIQRYISDHPNPKSPELTSLLEKLAVPLKNRGISQAVDEQDRIISSLKGFRNARFMTPEVSSLVRSIATNRAIPNRVRIAALQTMAVNSVDEANKKTALALFQTLGETSELRIAAFLLYVDSPTSETAFTVKNLLDAELSDQVGSFIVSWIRNLKTTTNPNREQLKHFYGNIQTKNKYPVDFRLYSQNYHLSHLFSSLNSGYSADANVIFSSETFAPRSTSLNLDTYIFGNSFNLFEFNGRFENVEYLLEKMMGPRSYVRTNKAEDIADDVSEMAKNLARQMAQKASLLGRGKREIRNIEETVSQLKQKISSSDKYMDIDLSMKMFESEIFWAMYHTDQSTVASGEYLDSLFNKIQQAIENAEDIDINYKRYARNPILSNNVINYPTSSGFSLKLSINAHTAVNFKMKGSVDAAKILDRPQSADVQLLIMPSAVVDIEGLLEIDASVISAGLKISSTMRSATGLNINLKMLDGNGYDFKIGLPVKEQDLLTIKTEAFTTMHERGLSPVEVPLQYNGKRLKYEGNFAQLAELTGLALQTEINWPYIGYRPTLGTGVFSVRLVKVDELLQDYHMKMFVNRKEAHYRSIEFLMDTPGSKINRKISFFADANSKEKKVTAKFITAKKEISFEAFGQTTNNEVYCLLNLRNDGSDYSAKLGATVIPENYRTTFKPYLELHSPYDVREETMAKHRLTPRESSQPFTIEGLIVLEKRKDSDTYRMYDFQKLALLSPFGKFEINGRVMVDNKIPRYGTDLVLTYGNKNTVSIKTGLNYMKNLPEDKQMRAAIAFMPSQFPSYAFKYMLNYNQTPAAYARTMIFNYGADLNSEVSKLTTREVLNTVKNPKTNKIVKENGSFGFAYPLWKTDISLSFQQTNQNFFSGSGTLDLDKTHIVLNGSVGVENIKPGTIEVKLQSQMNDKHLHLEGTRELIDEETSKILVDVSTKPGKQLRIEMNLTHRLKPDNYVIQWNSIVTVLPDNRIYKQEIGFVYNAKEKKFQIVFSPNNVRTLEISAGYTLSSPNFDANAVLYVRDSIDGKATLKAEPEKIDGDLRMEILRMRRLILGELEMEIHDGNHYTGHGEIQWDASKDKNKKIRIETNTLISDDKHDITTENDIQVINYHFQLNGNISMEGDLMNSTVQSHIQLVLSNETSMGVNLHREYKVYESIYNYNLQMNGYYIPPEEQEEIKLALGLNARDFDVSNYLFDLKTDLMLRLPKSKNLKYGFEIKRTLHNSQWTCGGNMYLDGTMVRKLDLSLETEFSDLVNDYGFLSKERSLPPTILHLHGSIGDDYVLDSGAKIQNGEISNVLLLKVPLQNKTFELKWTTNTKVDIVPSKYVNLRTTNSASWNDNKHANLNGKFEINPKSGMLGLAWESSDVTKRSMDIFYTFDDNQEGSLQGPFGRVGINLTIDGKEANCIGKIEFSKDLSTKVLTIVGQTPKNGSFEVRVESKVEDFGQKVFQDLSFTSNGQRWYASSLIVTYPTKPKINLQYSSPEADSTFMIQLEERIRNYWTGAINVSLMHGIAGYVKLTGELKLDTSDDILIKLEVDAPSFGADNFSFVANNKAVEGGKKRIVFTSRMDDQLLYAGSSSYIYHADTHKLTFEGAGTVRIDDKNHPFTFKYYRIQLDESTSGETGSASKLYISADNKKYALDLECKFTDKSFMLKRDLWRGDKCYKMDLSYQMKMTDVVNYEKNLLINFDLKPHIPNGELFTIEGKTVRSLSNYDQKLSLQWAPEKKVEYLIYSSSGKSGITFNLPKRQLGAEAVYVHELHTTDGNVRFTGTVWFDKSRDETKKLLLSTGVEYKVPENQNTFVVRSTSNLQLPSLPKSLSTNTILLLSLHGEKSIDFKTELDVFKKPEQMITISYAVFKGRKDDGYMIWSSLKAISEGQKMNTELKRSIIFYLDHMEYHLVFSYVNFKGIDKTALLDLEFRPTSLKGKISYDNVSLEGRSEIGMGKNYFEIREDFNIFGHEYKKWVRLTLDPSIIVKLEWRGKIKQTAVLNTTLVWNQALEVNLNLVGKGDIAVFKLYLNNKRFMNSETEFFIDNARILLDNGKDDLMSLLDDAQRSSKSAMNEIEAQYTYRSKQYRTANIDMRPLVESSNEYLTTLKNEIKADPSIISASQNVKRIISSVVDFVFIILQQTSSFLGDWVHGYDVLLDKVSEFSEDVVAKLNRLSQLSMDEITLYMRESLNQLWRLTLRFIDYAKANKTKWKEVILSFSDSVKDSYQIVSETFEKFKKDAQEFYERLRTYLASLPISNYLTDRFAQLKNSEILQYAWTAVREAGENIKEYMPNEEFRTLTSMIISTMDKVINERPYNLDEEMKGIYRQLMECMRVLIVKAADSMTYVRDTAGSYDYSLPQLSLSSFKSIPNIWTSSVSFVHWVREIDIPSTSEFLETFEVGSFNALELVPPFKKVGLVMDGQQVVTMNGHHYTINADCQYLLAADFDNLNFTVISTIKDGKMSSLSVTASRKQTIELYSNSMPTLNKVRQDYPIYGDGLYAIRNPASVEIFVDNSVYIYASLSLDICVIQISGFYYGKVFGLLGSTTSESYMDLLMPDMNVAKDLPTFVKSYQVNKKCKAPTQPAVADLPKSFECASMFNGKSIIRRGISFVKVKPYRDMCEDVVSRQSTPADKLNAACKAGLAFSLVSYTKGYYITLPPACSQCTMNGKSLAYGYSDSVKIPGNSADIFVVLDKSEQNRILYQELIGKAMKDIRSSLEKRNIRDIKFVLVGYGGTDERPSLYTTNGEVVLTENTNVKFSNSGLKDPSSELGKFVRKSKYFLGFYDARRALDVVNNYPFRPESANSIVQIDSSSQDYSGFDRYNIYNSMVNMIVSWNIWNSKIPVLLLTPKESVSVDVDNSSPPIFGFDFSSIFTANGPQPFKDGILGRLHLLEIYGGSVVLPISTNGAVYNSSVFVNADSDTRSKLTNVFSNRLVEGLVNVEHSVECVCRNKWSVYSELKCYPQ